MKVSAIMDVCQRWDPQKTLTETIPEPIREMQGGLS